MKYFAVVLLLSLSFTGLFPEKATLCRKYHNQQVCIFGIERSAKYFWEYKAVLSIDGAVRPREKYNCRDRVRIQKNGTVLPFAENDPGNVICSLFKG